ncbi:helix-turn-helix domain-containing protein [Iamia sp.]|uniref:helix-turn-helix domain-containing protein n=1 Tax=Iamia sp. TaxID=2722710 RepID=UPI002B7A715C|nr:helix-turn-helix domain-containing protein [Iamia sp.]HXH58908.1 helix-turn-helix domain-containing protein [Iamia sp.]
MSIAESSARWETAAELATRLGVSRATIYNELKRGLPSRKIGRARRFDPRQVDAFYEQS